MDWTVTQPRRSRETTSQGVTRRPATEGRVRVDGKFFAHGSRRLRFHGVTYGPFAPNQHDEPFPTPRQVRDDFQRMRDAGLNAIRTYHLPPQWLLQLANELGM